MPFFLNFRAVKLFYFAPEDGNVYTIHSGSVFSMKMWANEAYLKKKEQLFDCVSFQWVWLPGHLPRGRGGGLPALPARLQVRQALRRLGRGHRGGCSGGRGSHM